MLGIMVGAVSLAAGIVGTYLLILVRRQKRAKKQDILT